jgi:phenylalanyl-tRNA synthetase alpha chain
MPTVQEDLTQIEANYNGEIAQCQNTSEVSAVQVKYMGREGLITSILKRLSTVASESRAEVGHRINGLIMRMRDRARTRVSEISSDAEDD